MNATMPALEFDSVSVAYEGDARPSISNVTLRIGAGERVALLGNNGSGKTTLLFAAAGLVPHTGVIRIGGVALGPSTREEIRARLGFLFSNPEDQILLPRVLDDVAFALARRGVPAAEQSIEGTCDVTTAGLRRPCRAISSSALAGRETARCTGGRPDREAAPVVAG